MSPKGTARTPPANRCTASVVTRIYSIQLLYVNGSNYATDGNFQYVWQRVSNMLHSIHVFKAESLEEIAQRYLLSAADRRTVYKAYKALGDDFMHVEWEIEHVFNPGSIIWTIRYSSNVQLEL